MRVIASMVMLGASAHRTEAAACAVKPEEQRPAAAERIRQGSDDELAQTQPDE